MNVPPFIPPQIEVTGNVAEAPYQVRTVFVKRVVCLHTAFVALILSISLLPWPTTNLEAGALLTLAALLVLSLVRGVAKGWRHEQALSSICLPALAGGLALMTRSGVSAGIPFWVFGVVPLTMLAYVLLCGRDLSFVGMFTVGCLIIVATFGIAFGIGELQGANAGEIAVVLIGFTLYFVYDLAALQTRRRLGEEVGAVLDLFRDLLNFTTYPIRVVNHWRRHRIWSLRG